MHMAPMTTAERERARAWMKACRGAMSQETLVKELNAFFAGDTEPWSITRDRYSKYESGGADFGRAMFGRFVTYWTAKGEDAPNLTEEPERELSLEERQVIALERAADAAEAQVRVMASGFMMIALLNRSSEQDAAEAAAVLAERPDLQAVLGVLQTASAGPLPSLALGEPVGTR